MNFKLNITPEDSISLLQFLNPKISEKVIEFLKNQINNDIISKKKRFYYSKLYNQYLEEKIKKTEK